MEKVMLGVGEGVGVLHREVMLGEGEGVGVLNRKKLC